MNIDRLEPYEIIGLVESAIRLRCNPLLDKMLECESETIMSGGERFVDLACRLGDLAALERFYSLYPLTIKTPSPIETAAYYGHEDIVKWMISLGAPTNANYCRALRYASMNGHMGTVVVLLSHTNLTSLEHLLNAMTIAGHFCPLAAAIGEGHYDIAKILAEHVQFEETITRAIDSHLFPDDPQFKDVLLAIAETKQRLNPAPN